jgi:hypothetical protein
MLLWQIRVVRSYKTQEYFINCNVRNFYSVSISG